VCQVYIQNSQIEKRSIFVTTFLVSMSFHNNLQMRNFFEAMAIEPFTLAIYVLNMLKETPSNSLDISFHL
jgi:hypothetical protein